MKVSVLSESAADEAAIRVILTGVLGPTEQVGVPTKARGWPSVLHVLPTVLKHLHYQTDAEGLVVVADSNDSPVHHSSHDAVVGGDPECRLCRLREGARMASRSIRAVPGRSPLKIAVGVAVPAIEAWYLAGVQPQPTEAAWLAAPSGRAPFTKRSLKVAAYGTDRPSLALERERALEHARRLVGDLDVLVQSFPNGFGSLATSLRGW